MQSFRLLFVLLILSASQLFGQLTPIALTGFNNDAVAEAGPSSLATTSLQVDGGSSNKVMYTAAFATFAGITGGGLPDNGTIVNGADTYQLANYTGNNALYIYRNETRSFSLAAPASFTRLRVLAFTTEGASSLNISLSFTDGSTVNYMSGYSLSDWFNGTTNVVIQGFGRCSRVAAAPYGADAFPSNPRMYFIDIPVNCTDRSKLLQAINFSNVSTFPNNAPFPNAVIMALSGIGYSQTITPTITASDCNGPNGSINLSVSGSSSPYTYSWNTTPVQTGATATGLAPGNYTCIITDAGGCTSTYSGVVPLNNTGVLTATATPNSVCVNNPIVTLNATSLGAVYTDFTWNPGNLTGQSQTVNPVINTTYTVTATNALGCVRTAQVLVTVNPGASLAVASNMSVCPDGNVTLQVQNPEPGASYLWYDAPAGGTLLHTGITYPLTNVTASSTFYIQSVSSLGCLLVLRTPVSVSLNPVPAEPTANAGTVCRNADITLNISNPQTGYTYNWYDAATGGNLLGTGTSIIINNVLVNTTVYTEAVNSSGCVSNTRVAVPITLLSQHPAPVVTLTNTTFTSLSFSWNAVPGATGYMVTANGGTSFSQPSSGPQGTTHIINGLTGNTTVTLQVIALGVQACETSNLSGPVKGTTLSSKEIFVPNVFTPNGDGRNDKLLVFGNYISSIRFSVFNQWGQLLFVSENINNGWDGIYKGYPQPIGVYAYTLRVVLQDGTIINKKGSFNLVR